jgi:hypothetical protein
MNLYDLPKELLIEIITRIPHDAKNEDQMRKRLCENFVQKHICEAKGCIDFCMSIHHPSNADDIHHLKKDDDLEWNEDEIIYFAFPDEKDLFTASQIEPGKANIEIQNKIGAMALCCKLWYCKKHWHHLYGGGDGTGYFECENGGGG